MGSQRSEPFHCLQGKSRDSVHKSQYHEEKGQPKRGVEPTSFRLPAERLTTRPCWLTCHLVSSPVIILYRTHPLHAQHDARLTLVNPTVVHRGLYFLHRKSTMKMGMIGWMGRSTSKGLNQHYIQPIAGWDTLGKNWPCYRN